MDQCFRIALWMFFLIGYLQANPVPNAGQRERKSLHFNKDDLAFDYLRKGPSCGNMTFISPTNMMDNYHATLQCFIEGLKNASAKCTKVDRIEQALEVLDPQLTPTNSSECGKWENEGSRKQYRDFVNDIEKFVEAVYSNPKND